MKSQKIIIILLVVAIALLAGNLFFLVKNQEKDNTPPIASNSGDSENIDKIDEIKSGDDTSSVIVKDEIEVEPEKEELEITKEYDVIVFGAEPEGICVAISAARNNLNVLLVEKRDGPGGLMTYAMLNTIDINMVIC